MELTYPFPVSLAAHRCRYFFSIQVPSCHCCPLGHPRTASNISGTTPVTLPHLCLWFSLSIIRSQTEKVDLQLSQPGLISSFHQSGCWEFNLVKGSVSEISVDVFQCLTLSWEWCLIACVTHQILNPVDDLISEFLRTMDSSTLSVGVHRKQC